MKRVLLVLLFCSCSTLKEYGLQGVPPARPIFHPVWIKNHDPEHNKGNLPVALQGVLVNQNIVYVGHAEGKMFAYDLDNGRPVWAAKDKGRYHSTPIAVDNLITYGTVKGRLYARHRLNGTLLWEVDLGDVSEGQGVISKDRLYIHMRSHQIFCLSAKSGKVLWSYKHTLPHSITLQGTSRPLIKGKRLYVGFADGTVVALNASSGVRLWETKIGTKTKLNDVNTSPIFFGNQLITGGPSAPLTILNKNNGSILRRLPYTVLRPPLPWGNRLIVGTVDGDVVVLNKNLRKLYARNLSSAPISSILFWKKGLVISTLNGHLLYANPQTLKVQSSLQLGHRQSAFFTDLIIHDNKLVAYSSRNRLYVFK